MEKKIKDYFAGLKADFENGVSFQAIIDAIVDFIKMIFDNEVKDDIL